MNRYAVSVVLFVGIVLVPVAHAMAPKRVDLSGSYQLKMACIDLKGQTSNLALPRPSAPSKPAPLAFSMNENFPIQIFQDFDADKTEISYQATTLKPNASVITRLKPGKFDLNPNNNIVGDIERKVRWRDGVLELSDCSVMVFKFPGVDESSFQCYEWRFSKGPHNGLKVQYRNRVGGESRGEPSSEVLIEQVHCVLSRI